MTTAGALDRLPCPFCVVDHSHAVPPRHQLQGRPGPDERPAARLLSPGDGLEQERGGVAVVGGDETAVGEDRRERVAEEPLVQGDEVGPALSRGRLGRVDELLEGREARVVGGRVVREGPRGSWGLIFFFFFFFRERKEEDEKEEEVEEGR